MTTAKQTPAAEGPASKAPVRKAASKATVRKAATTRTGGTTTAGAVVASPTPPARTRVPRAGQPGAVAAVGVLGQAPRTARKVAHLTVDQHIARGKAARNEVPRSSHAGFQALPGRPDPVALLESQATTRLPELLPIRYGRMSSSPFAFFRGAALVMASDLAGTPRSGLHAQVCGDAHLSNFGIFASPERSLVFDLNDFDETVPGPWEWDLKRLAASLEVAARQNAFTAAEARAVVLAGVGTYRRSMSQFADMSNLDVWYSKLEVEATLQRVRSRIDPTRARRIDRDVAKAKTRDHLQAFSKLVTDVDGQLRFISNPPLLVPVEEIVGEIAPELLHEVIRRLLRAYRSTLAGDRRVLLESYDYVQLARKVVGVGSVGTRCWVALLLGRDTGDPLLLQVKEAPPSVLEEFVGRSRYANSGQRVVEGQRLMQAASDIFLGWQRTRGMDGVARDFYVRQLRDWKTSLEIEAMQPRGMTVYAELCGWTLARAHARSGDRIAIAAYLGKSAVFDRALAQFASDYADQNARDHQALLDAIAAGRVKAVTGV
jgi:uncharacterized protein (DUF2252 family)